MDESVLSKLRILTQSLATLVARTAPGRIVAVVFLMGVGIVAAFGLAPDSMLPEAPTQLVTRELALPPLTPAPPDAGYWREERIQRGDTLGGVLARCRSDPAAQNFPNRCARPVAVSAQAREALRVQTTSTGD